MSKGRPGTIRKRSDGRWEARYTVDVLDKSGAIQQEQRSVYGKTKREATEKMWDKLDEAESRDRMTLPSKNTPTVGEWLDTWLKEYKKNSVSASTYSTYERNIRTHLKPAFGDIPLTDIRPDLIQRFLNLKGEGDTRSGKEVKPLSPWTVTKLKVILHNALEYALKNAIITMNPVSLTTAPRIADQEVRILSNEEQRKLMSTASEYRLEALYIMALGTGMRRGELMALTWNNIDMDAMSIYVKSTVARIKDPDTGISTLTDTGRVKTQNSKRRVPLLPSMSEVLIKQQERIAEERQKAGSAWQEHNLVFPSSVGTYIEPRRVGTTLDKIAQKAGIERVTFHALRHTFATRMLEVGVSPKVVAEILGHKDVTLTLNIYSHVLPTTAEEQMKRIDGIFQRKDED